MAGIFSWWYTVNLKIEMSYCTSLPSVVVVIHWVLFLPSCGTTEETMVCLGGWVVDLCQCHYFPFRPCLKQKGNCGLEGCCVHIQWCKYFLIDLKYYGLCQSVSTSHPSPTSIHSFNLTYAVLKMVLSRLHKDLSSIKEERMRKMRVETLGSHTRTNQTRSFRYEEAPWQSFVSSFINKLLGQQS